MTNTPKIERFSPLFKPIKIGPKLAKNRFYQVPHCNGMGRNHPSAMAGMRGVKAEGGWGVVCTEQCDIHYSSCHPRELRLWDSIDIPVLSLAREKIHEHGALAGIELAHNGFHVNNMETRVVPLAPSGGPTRGISPVNARAMTKSDIIDFRRWHRNAVINAKKAGFDIIYIYAAHDMTLPVHFISRNYNQRSDEYGGNLKNRIRLLRELLEDAQDAVQGECAIALRFSVDELVGDSGITCDGEGKEIVQLLSDLPDLWDVNISSFANDGKTSRFASEGYQEEFIRFVKSCTEKPVVGVGRYTSPDKMLALIETGVLDFIGAARPSISDPFLPQKIFDGNFDDIRECIGCNMCVASDKLSVPIRCTQNPTIGEEWRRGWHPEKIAPKLSHQKILVVGGGPAGLEAALWLGKREYEVYLADAEESFGGRIVHESKLPSLSEWRRVADWRIHQLKKNRFVNLLPKNRISADVALEAEFDLIAVATGATWRSDGVGRIHFSSIPGISTANIITPDDIFSENLPCGRVLIFDDDHFYMGGLLAEKLIGQGCEVVFVTSDPLVSAFTAFTAEHQFIQKRILEICQNVYVSHKLSSVNKNEFEISCMYTNRSELIQADTCLLVTSRMPNEELFLDIRSKVEALDFSYKIPKVRQIGDCHAPGTIASAVFSGHNFARTLDNKVYDYPDYRREITLPSS